MSFMRLLLSGLTVLAISQGCAQEPAPTRMTMESFDRDPNWDGHNNRFGAEQAPVEVRQDFGYSPTSHAGGRAGEMGGFIVFDAEPAYYAKVIEPKTFDDPLGASGTFAMNDGGTHLLLGFFNAETANEWRTPNTIALRLNGRGKQCFAYVEYGTSKWRAGGRLFALPEGQTAPATPTTKTSQTTEGQMYSIPSGGVIHKWSLNYDPAGNNGAGTISATIDDITVSLDLQPGHKADGATFNRFGIINAMKSAIDSMQSPEMGRDIAPEASRGTETYFDNLVINGQAEDFAQEPKWEGKNNHRTHHTRNVRRWFDFGYSDTHHAGGKARGEIGGLIFRGDERFPERMAYYGDKLDGVLTLDKPLRASGKVALARGVTDSGVAFGFFHSTDSMKLSKKQTTMVPENCVAVLVEGPSSEGFKFFPTYGVNQDDLGFHPVYDGSPYIYPDGKSHDWTLEYDPAGAGGNGRITVTLDGESVSLDLKEEHRKAGARFDRFGIITTHIDGNGQHVYLDDLTYTIKQE